MFALDSVTVWDRVLSALEVSALYGDDFGLDYPFMGGPFSLLFQANLINDPATPLVLGAGPQLWTASRSFDGDNFIAEMDLLFSGNRLTEEFAWSADNFSDKIIFAQHDNTAQYWTPPLPNLSRDLPGLPSTDAKWDGVTVFFGHVVLWKEDRLKWSDKDDFTLYIPVGETAVSTDLTLNDDFIQPAIGGTVTVKVSNPNADVVSISLSGSLSFPNTNVGDTSQEILTITNSGTAPLIVTGLSLPDGFSGEFVGTIPVNGSHPVVITFAPTEAIDYTGTVTVASNATLGTSALPLSGTGLGNTKIIELSGTLNFGSVLLTKSLVSSLVIKNKGNTTLTVSSITLPTGYSGSYAGTIAAGASHTVAITFSPTAALSYAGNVTVTSNSTSGSGEIPISGLGVKKLPEAIFLTDNGSCQFGNVPDGTTVTGTLRIYNPGSNSIKVIGLTLPGGFTGAFAGTIAAFGFHDVTISFTPVNPVSYSGLVTVATSKVLAGTNFLEISGTGTATGKIISLSGSLDFGNVPISSFIQNVLTITNVGTVDITVSSISYPNAVFTGAFSGVITPGQSKHVLVTFTPTAATSYGGNLTVNSDATGGTGTFPLTGEGVALPTPVTLQSGQFVSLQDKQGDLDYYNFYSVVSMTGTSLVLKLLDLTGLTPSGLTITSGKTIFSLDANEAGETRVTGASMNGEIWQVIPQGDFAYIMKERSIQSVQYVGATSGTFFIHPEVSGEGLISRYAVANVRDGRIVFLGHKELYQYTGGPNPTPVCQQTTRQLYNELDRTRLHTILLYNHESRNELWVQYPKIGGGFRVLIWNYVEDTSSFDDYPSDLLFTALGVSDWSADVTWEQLPDSSSWDSYDAGITWDDLVGASQDHITLLGSEDGNLRIYGLRYAREGQGYLSLSETMDYDLGDSDIWKYVDVVKLGLQVLIKDTVPRIMYVTMGTQADLGGDIVWSDPQPVLVNGQSPVPVIVNPGGAGRYLRLRFSSTDADVQWRVSSFEIHCRPGATY